MNEFRGHWPSDKKNADREGNVALPAEIHIPAEVSDVLKQPLCDVAAQLWKMGITFDEINRILPGLARGQGVELKTGKGKDDWVQVDPDFSPHDKIRVAHGATEPLTLKGFTIRNPGPVIEKRTAKE